MAFRRAFLGLAGVVLAGAAVIAPLAASASTPIPKTAAPHIVGTWADDVEFNQAGGYVLYNNGAVYALNGAPYYGSATASKLTNFVALVPDTSGNGYWLITSNGKVFSEGSTCLNGKLVPPKPAPASAVVGAINFTGNNSNEGFAMVTAARKLWNFTCVITFARQR